MTQRYSQNFLEKIKIPLFVSTITVIITILTLKLSSLNCCDD